MFNNASLYKVYYNASSCCTIFTKFFLETEPDVMLLKQPSSDAEQLLLMASLWSFQPFTVRKNKHFKIKHTSKHNPILQDFSFINRSQKTSVLNFGLMNTLSVECTENNMVVLESEQLS